MKARSLAAATAAAVVLAAAALAAAAGSAAPPSNVMIWGELFSDSGVLQTVNEPVPLPGSVSFVEAAGGMQFACLRTADGRAYCVGSNRRGQLGVGGDVEQSGVPLPVAGGKRYHQVLVAAWASYACGLLDAPGTPEDRTLECWGQSDSVWTADPLLINSTAPQPFKPEWAWEQAVVADGFICGIPRGRRGEVACTGVNVRGELGRGFNNSDADPVELDMALVVPPYPNVTWELLVGTYGYSCALDTKHVMYCWGGNGFGRLGFDFGLDVEDYPAVTVPTATTPGHRFRTISVGGENGCGIEDDGSDRLWCWGITWGGAVGCGPISPECPDESVHRPVPVSADRRFRDVYVGIGFSCAITTDGETLCWGSTYSDENKMVLGRGSPPPGAEGANDTRFDPRTPGPPKGGYRFRSIAPALNSVLGVLEGEPQPSTSSGGLSGGAIAGIAVGAAAAAALLAGGAWVAYSRRRAAASGLAILPVASGTKHGPSTGTDSTPSSNPSSELQGSGSLPSLPHALALLKQSDYSIDRDAAGAPCLLGEGNFGVVYRGRLGLEPAAIKVLRGRQLGELDREGFLKEVSILKSCRSQHLVGFLGAYLGPDEVAIVTELCAGGSLWRALHGDRPAGGRITWSNGGGRIALGIARGLHYLHAKARVVHLDLKSPNVLLTEGGDAKIADVGLAQVLPVTRAYLSQAGAVGTLAWASPEQLLGQRCSFPADIWSLGIILWEIATGEAPRRGQLRELTAEEAPPEVNALIEGCLHSEPAQRPTAEQVVARLEALLG